MSEDKIVEAAVAMEADDTGATVVAAVGDETGVQAAGAVVTDYHSAVIVAAFNDTSSAEAVYERLKSAESSGALGIEGVLVVRTDDEAKVKIQRMTDHSTKTGVKWGAVGGVVLGIFFPPSIIAGAVGAGVAGGVLGKVRNEWHKSEAGKALTGALGPNQSGILALCVAKDVEKVKAEMPEATSVRSAGVDEATAASIKEAAASAEA
jgi:uncharacterized membrane protein